MTQILYGTLLAGRHPGRRRGDVDPCRSARTGRPSAVRSKYLVACDGAGSAVRRAAGIEFEGKQLDYSVSAMIEVEHLDGLPPARPRRAVHVHRHGGDLGQPDRGRRTRAVAAHPGRLGRAPCAGETRRRRHHEAGHGERRRRVDGAPGDAVAPQPVHGRPLSSKAGSLLAGDAAHTTSPTGGHGLNTGIGDVSDLGWMLDALLRGWGGDQLLAAYNAERRPVAIRNGTSSTKNYGAWVQAVGRDLVLDDTPAGEAQRRAVGDQMNAMLASEWHSFGVAMGYRYDASPIVIPDGAPPTPDEPGDYVQTARPGHRAPHAWLADGRSTHRPVRRRLHAAAPGVRRRRDTAHEPPPPTGACHCASSPSTIPPSPGCTSASSSWCGRTAWSPGGPIRCQLTQPR